MQNNDKNAAWPDFSRSHYYEAILDYQKRERRFGKTSAQIDMAVSNESST